VESVEKQNQLFHPSHRPWKTLIAFSTFPQPRRRFLSSLPLCSFRFATLSEVGQIRWPKVGQSAWPNAPKGCRFKSYLRSQILEGTGCVENCCEASRLGQCSARSVATFASISGLNVHFGKACIAASVAMGFPETARAHSTFPSVPNRTSTKRIPERFRFLSKPEGRSVCHFKVGSVECTDFFVGMEYNGAYQKIDRHPRSLTFARSRQLCPHIRPHKRESRWDFGVTVAPNGANVGSAANLHRIHVGRIEFLPPPVRRSQCGSVGVWRPPRS
jgi:hypothetical protein